MGTAQILMLMGATIAGTFFAVALTQQNPFHRNLYNAFGVVGTGLIIVGYLSV
ncbi:hypothetical protein [Bacillus sp. M6-12]|uniref:hypothetical protein n=1 Tax=Bacillus sp. M6-12 TaxID=2054166 RepID=UPI0015E083A9|nr:hypothetical protein [Bacillus sp. M6-12]